jgi:hypothetical protein
VKKGQLMFIGSLPASVTLLALRPVHIEMSQGSDTAGSFGLEVLELVEDLVRCPS